MRDLVFVGSSQADLRAFPDDARREVGYALFLAQSGNKHPAAKPLKGFRGAGVLEIVEDNDGSTYRLVYTLTLPDAIYVLHAFQKKSKRGIATPKKELDLIQQRLKAAEAMSAQTMNHDKGEQT